jgi:uncharacterized protein YegL
MKCSKCGRQFAPGDLKCGDCGTPRSAIEPAFARAEQEYVKLRAQFDAGSLPPDQFKAAVEAQMVDHGGRYWMVGVDSGKWYAYDGANWQEADPPLATGSARASASTSASAAAAADRPRRPGGEMARRPLHFLWIADCSGSMATDGKIQALNNAIREAIPHMQTVARENPNAQVLVRALAFSDGARWHVAPATPVEDFRWTDLQAAGVTDMGRALRMVADELRIPPMTQRALPPVLVLISDGQPTDEFDDGLAALMREPWGMKAARVSIAIGADADLEVLQSFIGNTGLAPLQANNPESLVNHIKWVSTAVLKSASMPASQGSGAGMAGGNVPIPVPADNADTPAANDVW